MVQRADKMIQRRGQIVRIAASCVTEELARSDFCSNVSA